MKPKILIVEDEAAIVEFIMRRLDTAHYDIDVATDGALALEQIQNKHYDLVTLDIMLPHYDGFELAKAIRQRSKTTLIIMASALGAESFKTKGYEQGADDYIAKPFSPKMLAVKIETLLRRRAELRGESLPSPKAFDHDHNNKSIRLHGNVLTLTPSEYLILSTLIENPKHLFSRADLAQLIYDHDMGSIDEQSIDSHMSHIRKKLRVFEETQYITTVRGMGYKLS